MAKTKKKKATTNTARGFATTSTPSKIKPSEPPVDDSVPSKTEDEVSGIPKPGSGSSNIDEKEYTIPTEEEQADFELQCFVEKNGPKVNKESQRIVSKTETEKRTIRNICFPLKLEKILRFNLTRYASKQKVEEDINQEVGLGEQILRLAREEQSKLYPDQPKAFMRRGETLLVNGWILHKTLTAMGFPSRRVEEGLRALAGRSSNSLEKEKGLESAMEDILDWLALYCDEDELPGFLDASPGSGNVSKRGSSGESEEDEGDLNPEQLIPGYIKLQTQIYNLNPVLTAISGSKKGGKGRKTTQAPKELSSGQMKSLKKLQDKLRALIQDPLLDLRSAEFTWAEERLRLEKESWTKKQPKGKWDDKNSHTSKQQIPLLSEGTVESDEEDSKEAVQFASSEHGSIEDDDDLGMDLIGGLFEPPPTEETTIGQNGEEIVSIRNFEEEAGFTVSSFGKNKPKGKTGVGLILVKSVLDEVCKSRDVGSKVRYEMIPGTSISTRSRLTINWSSIAAASSFKTILNYNERPPVIVNSPSLLSTVFSMNSFGTPTKEQAEGYIATYALFQLCSKKEEKIYLRLPTLWRGLWAELVEEARLATERQEREILKGLQVLLEIGSNEYVSEELDTAEKKKKRVTKDDFDKSSEEVQDVNLTKLERSHETDMIREGWEYKKNTPEYLHMLNGRKQLPMWAFKDEVLAAIDREQVVIICGETGCGKSTQTPAFILEHQLSQGKSCKIYCTEPRRISAISLARRVSEELGERKSDLGGKNSLVGYAIRLESNMHAETRLVYATTGIVVRMLERSPDLEEVTHLVLDEVHERSIDSDFLMIVLKKLLSRRKDLKVVLMSATVDAEKFSKYLNGAPVMNVPGRTFPVRTHYLEDAIEVTGFKAEEDSRNPRNRNDWADDNDAEVDTDKEVVLSTALTGYSKETKSALSRINPHQIQYELIMQLLEKVAFSPEYINYSKAILIFLPGMGEIRRLNDLLSAHPVFGSNKKDGGWLVYPLHSTIASEDQEAAFLVPPQGMRKIVIATNIAETGITIPDVTCVIDSGKHKEMRFDERRQLSRLVETFMAEQQSPEMMRLSLQDLALRVKICKLGGIEEILAQALDAPLPKNIKRAIDSLIEAKALTLAEELTPLGCQLAKLPLDVYLGKMVLLGSVYGCLDAVTTIAAILSSKSPFVTPMGYRKEADAIRFSFKRGDSDLLTGWNAYSSWRRVCQGTNITESDFCRKNYLSSRTLSGIEDLKQQLIVAVIDAGFFSLTSEERNYLNRCRFNTYRRRNFFIAPNAVNHSSENDSVVNAVVAAGFYPKLLQKDGKGWKNVVNGQNIAIHPSSVNKYTRSEWLAFYGIMQSNNFYDAHETGHVDDITVALLCGDVDFKMYSGVLVLDGNRVRFAFQDWKKVAGDLTS
ncbi:P-loop containing nucleoside triphosphate hydrolase protein [Morchella conica CCBAS932]|uniref:RNA helicase n=1 Tax=Morchella conica CCBAS932 TaxID=1392247 RepID=A0A3N4L7F5_9PEZI|nr:P-loop containing nucleoside triphosphate hydrolase protein [Morchella conica CCBAS932]